MLIKWEFLYPSNAFLPHVFLLFERNGIKKVSQAFHFVQLAESNKIKDFKLFKAK